MTQELELLLAEQEQEFRSVINKMAGKKYGKVNQSVIHKLADRHVKQQVRLINKMCKKEAKKQYMEEDNKK